MNARASRKSAVLTVILTGLAGPWLAGCASPVGSSDDSMSRFLVSPGKYEMYTCAPMAALLPALRTREGELVVLTAKAESGPGGALAATVAYRPEYLEVHGEIAEIDKTRAAKNCPPPVAAEEPAPNPRRGTPPRR